jgi:molybdopterin-guanine dinucleotide biosynthesis protein A
MASEPAPVARAQRSTAPLLGIFVGGASRRMGSPKGLLRAPDEGRAGASRARQEPAETLVERLVRVGAEAGLDVCLVGEASAYAQLVPALPRLPDAPEGVGPLAGLAALLAAAGERPAVSVACDMPFVDADALRKVAFFPTLAAVVAPRRGPAAPFEPMLARWEPGRVLPELRAALGEGVRSFQALLRRLEVEPLPVDDALSRALVDWDAPEDLAPPR